MNIRFAIFAAVSTAEQAGPDKISLDVQVERCRSAALAKGWQETAGPFIAAGASRSFYVNLSDAEAAIPALKELLDAAHANRYDVLVIYTYDRLGDLADLVAQSLRFDGKQLYSISQAVEPQPPNQFDPYNAEAEAIMRDASRITQRFRIDDLRRKWRIGIPARVRKGLTPLRVPYGYVWTGKKTPPRLDHVAASVLLRIRDEFMVGQSLRSICLRLAAKGIPSPSGRSSWDPSTLSYLLANPYYAGIVSIGKTICIRDPRSKNQYRQVHQPASRWVNAPGLHKPLWDETTHQAILAELQRRRTQNQRTAIRFPFSGLLTCAVCHRKIYRGQNGGGAHRRRRMVLECEAGAVHLRLDYDTGFDLISGTLVTAITTRTSEPPRQPEQSSNTRNNQALAELKIRRRRIQEGYESGLYTRLEAAERLSTLTRQEETLQEQARQGEQTARSWAEWQKNMASHPDLLKHFSDWVRTDDPALVNRLLSSIVETILIYPDHRVEIVWRK